MVTIIPCSHYYRMGVPSEYHHGGYLKVSGSRLMGFGVKRLGFLAFSQRDMKGQSSFAWALRVYRCRVQRLWDLGFPM